MRGVPLIYTGQEVVVNVKMPFFDRYPINWAYNPNLFAEYKRLMAIYTASETAKTGTITTYANNDIITFKKSKNGLLKGILLYVALTTALILL